jgi:hypothetical protein
VFKEKKKFHQENTRNSVTAEKELSIIKGSKLAMINDVAVEKANTILLNS